MATNKQKARFQIGVLALVEKYDISDDEFAAWCKRILRFMNAVERKNKTLESMKGPEPFGPTRRILEN